MFGQQSPDGWPEEGAAWVNSGTMLQRIAFGANVAAGRAPALPVERWAGWATLSTLPLDRQTEGVVALLLGGFAEPATREVLLGTRGDSATPRLRELIAVALASPEFQRR
jgi:hypothetical protein